jgi:hypothetical protein
MKAALEVEIIKYRKGRIIKRGNSLQKSMKSMRSMRSMRSMKSMGSMGSTKVTTKEIRIKKSIIKKIQTDDKLTDLTMIYLYFFLLFNIICVDI